MKAGLVLSGERRAALLHGEARETLAEFPDASVDAVVTDPPAGISFMGKVWDHDHGGRDGWIEAFAVTFSECFRVLKPGAHALVWALPRTSHWTATALEDAGFEIRDVVTHHFGTGFPKSLDVSKAIDKAAGVKRKVVGTKVGQPGYSLKHQDTGGYVTSEKRNQLEGALTGRGGDGSLDNAEGECAITAPATDDAKQWKGWGTALKPATEHWILARKPLIGTVAANVQEHGTGALNVDGCRVEGVVPQTVHGVSSRQGEVYGKFRDAPELSIVNPAGRWPPNLLLTHAVDCGEDCAEECPVREMDQQSGFTKDGVAVQRHGGGQKLFGGIAPGASKGAGKRADQSYKGSGGASRFFPRFRYQAKASRKERNAGLEGMPERRKAQLQGALGDRELDDVSARYLSQPMANVHPTVKPIDLMRWLCRLVAPPGGVVLDPFMGSGSTGVACAAEGLRFVGIEREEEYVQLAAHRVSAALEKESA